MTPKAKNTRLPRLEASELEDTGLESYTDIMDALDEIYTSIKGSKRIRILDAARIINLATTAVMSIPMAESCLTEIEEILR